jgi:hypothetical protein
MGDKHEKPEARVERWPITRSSPVLEVAGNRERGRSQLLVSNQIRVVAT